MIKIIPTNTDNFPSHARLAESLQDVNGNLLMQEGVTITPDILRGLRERGIAVVRVDVYSDEVTTPASVCNDIESYKKDIEDRLKYLFRSATGSGQINPLHHLVFEYRLQGAAHDNRSPFD